jgi:hypothetical protein
VLRAKDSKRFAIKDKRENYTPKGPIAPLYGLDPGLNF